MKKQRLRTKIKKLLEKNFGSLYENIPIAIKDQVFDLMAREIISMFLEHSQHDITCGVEDKKETKK